jgi:N-acetylmuramoyl-L-alanine amidase
MPRIYVSPSSQEHNTGPNGYVEEIQMNLVADVLCPELTRHGIEWMRNDTENLYYDHVAESNEYMKGYSGDKYHIAIHSNAGGGKGCTSFCYNASNLTAKGTIFATNLFNRIIEISPFQGRGVRSTTMDEVEKTTAPACLIEVEFHDNAEGASWITSHINEIAHALLLGILDTLKIAYIPVEPPVDYKVLYDELLLEHEATLAELEKEKQYSASLQSKIDSAIVTLSAG